MFDTDAAMRLLHRILFGRESCALFVGIKLSGALFQASSATSLEVALWSVIPWLGSMFVDVLWYAAPVLLKKIVLLIPMPGVPLGDTAMSVAAWLRLRFSST